MKNQMLPGSNGHEKDDFAGVWGMGEGDPAHDEWFSESMNRLRQRKAREGSWVEQPTREIVSRLIDWFEDE